MLEAGTNHSPLRAGLLTAVWTGEQAPRRLQLDVIMRTPMFWLVAASFALGGAAHGRHQDVPAPPAPELASLVKTYCVSCHNDKLKTADLSLQSADLTNVPAHGQIWEKVARKLRSGEMPPSNVRSR